MNSCLDDTIAKWGERLLWVVVLGVLPVGALIGWWLL